MRKLEYSIHKYSSYATSYSPENIQEDKCSDQSSRWSSETNYPPQYLILKLNNFAIVDSITFGKYEKSHVCNLKKFKIFCGLTESCTMELIESGLKNDNVPETFPIRATIMGHSIPCRYIKILPLQCWGPSFNFSIWYVELTGMDDPSMVESCIEWFSKYQESEVVRLCLKHFRQHNYNEAFDVLQKQTDIVLEDPKITKLHEILVIHGNYDETENFMESAINENLFSDYIKKQNYSTMWHPITFDEGESDARPGKRGGHQMCIDPYNEVIYLFGGWDGNQDMNDFWSYSIPTKQWTLISKDTEAQGGPGSRSCHKVCLDTKRRQIFTLGRYLDTQFRSSKNLKSDFYMYDIESNTWTMITEDTAHMGGPQLTFDHQMCMDVKNRTIYVFGGRILTPPFFATEDGSGSLGLAGPSEVKFSGLYSYHVPTNTWTLIHDDCASVSQTRPGATGIKSRVGHSMLFHPVYRKLYIFAGQRSKDYLNDFFTYNVDTGEIQQISDGTKNDSSCIPGSGFTQRATLDADLNEIYVLSGLSKDKEKRDDNVQNSFWVYSITQNKWTCIYRNENFGEQYWNKMKHVEPCPRFAHQLAYDHVNKIHYLFGGNPGRSYLPKMRLDDFWLLQLTRPSHEQLLQKFKFLIRKHRFEELAVEDSLTALSYLQTCVSDIIDHEDPEQTKQFQLLAAVLFQNQLSHIDRPTCSTSTTPTHEEVHIQRTLLFNKLADFFPTYMTQPKLNLIDLIPFVTHSGNESVLL